MPLRVATRLELNELLIDNAIRGSRLSTPVSAVRGFTGLLQAAKLTRPALVRCATSCGAAGTPRPIEWRNQRQRTQCRRSMNLVPFYRCASQF
ncbi:protein of unknown function [Candidatus Filomicrobium marinum]|uniref:Uncharacterized protein n=1 Tax=Candidatus Filomicrobium marinum TaxID=1608628 RepID=A0A0D6JKH0_9HYPH|nr:protein of unknown function [Candidatus Filomicrobium marinum]CPR22464.1 protein of unknown function [Candidatus Filomicrobium marinum]